MFVRRTTLLGFATIPSLPVRPSLASVVRFFPLSTGVRTFSARVNLVNLPLKKVAISLCSGGLLLANCHAQKANSPSEEIQSFFERLPTLKSEKNREEIVKQGEIALSIAKKAHHKESEAMIYAELASAFFCLGDYMEALQQTTHCQNVSRKFEDPFIFIHSLYLESSIYRALAQTMQDRHTQQMFFSNAESKSKQALKLLSDSNFLYKKLQGKILVNLALLQEENCEGNLKVAEQYYINALECFREKPAEEDFLHTRFRLTLLLARKNFPSTLS